MLQAGSMHRTSVTFETAPFAEATEITGPVKLVLWVSSNVKDMDMFVTVRNIGVDGNDVWEVGQQGQKVPVAKGWLRASHRKLDPKRSLPYRPFHAHDERWWLKPGEPVECEIEIWPMCMVFGKGHRIRLDGSRATAPVDQAASAYQEISGYQRERRKDANLVCHLHLRAHRDCQKRAPAKNLALHMFTDFVGVRFRENPYFMRLARR